MVNELREAAAALAPHNDEIAALLVRASLKIVELSTALHYAEEDTQRIELLEALNRKAEYTGRCTLRTSTTERGWRLHETSREEALGTVREAIDEYAIINGTPGGAVPRGILNVG